MKSLRNKVLLSGIVLLFALIATIGSTYAWFTVSNTVSVTQFTLTASTEEALLGRVWNQDDATVGNYTPDDFFNTLNILYPDNGSTPSGYYVTHNSGIASWRLTPVTCVDSPATTGLTDYTTLDFTGINSGDGLGLRRVVLSDTSATTRTYSDYTTNVNNTTGGYITVKFWLMDPSTDNVNVTLSSLSVTSSNAALANSIYVGVLGDTNERVYPVSSDYGFEFLSGQPGYSSAVASINTIPSSNITTLEGLEKSAGDNTTIITLDNAMTPELVTVYIWIEGWDAQATNGIMGDSLQINFNFAIAS